MLLALGLAVCAGIIHACISSKGPFLKLANKVCDFGEVDYNQEVSVVVPFSNVGTERLVITEVEAGCTCILCEVNKQEYQPGEKGFVRIKFAARASPGESLTKTLRILSNDARYPVREVAIQGRMAPSLSVFPREIDFGNVNVGSSPRVFVVVSSLGLGRTFQILSAATDLPGARVLGPWDVRTSESKGNEFNIADSVAYRMCVELPLQRTLGSFNGSLMLRTTSEISPEITVPIKGSVVSSMVIRPASLFFLFDGRTRNLKRQVTVSCEYPFSLMPPTALSPIRGKIDSASRSRKHTITFELMGNDKLVRYKGKLCFRVEGHPYEEMLTIPFAIVIANRVTVE